MPHVGETDLQPAKKIEPDKYNIITPQNVKEQTVWKN